MYSVIRTPIQPNLCSYTLALPPHQMVQFLGYTPQYTVEGSKGKWPGVPEALQNLYRTKQRETDPARVAALEEYIVARLIGGQCFAAFPPLSVIQFEPIEPEHLKQNGSGLVLDTGTKRVTRMLGDGLARYAGVANVRKRLEAKSEKELDEFDNQFQFTVTLYAPVIEKLSWDEAGQLFHDFNVYAWKVSTGKAVSADMLNPYVICARHLSDSPGMVVKRYGGVKSGGSGRLGSKEGYFTTELAMSQFCKISTEGRRAVGQGFTKPVGSSVIKGRDPKEVAEQINHFLGELSREMGHARFSDRKQLFRTAHSLEAIAVVVNAALFSNTTTVEKATRGIASVNWTWENEDFCRALGRKNSKGEWVLNTGTQTKRWLIDYLLPRCVY